MEADSTARGPLAAIGITTETLSVIAIVTVTGVATAFVTGSVTLTGVTTGERARHTDAETYR